MRTIIIQTTLLLLLLIHLIQIKSLPRSTPKTNNRWHTTTTTTPSSSLISTPSSSSSTLSPPSPPLPPPWNPSPQIDTHGFLHSTYHRITGGETSDEPSSESFISSKHTSPRNIPRYLATPVHIRQVPGDGNCLFHAIAISLYHAINRTHYDYYNNNDNDDLRSRSLELRQSAVECLMSQQKKLFLEGKSWLRASDLVNMAATQEGISAEEYCTEMRREGTWGGGPEIVALCNVLRRPIHVYELNSTFGVDEYEDDEDEEEDEDDEDEEELMHLRNRNRPSVDAVTPSSLRKHRIHHGNNKKKKKKKIKKTHFRLRRMACFGSPKFDRQEPLHILSADSRFPDIQPGDQRSMGNHFLAMFPDHDALVKKERRRRKKRRRMMRATTRGGGGGGGVGVDLEEERVLLSEDDVLMKFDGENGGLFGWLIAVRRLFRM